MRGLENDVSAAYLSFAVVAARGYCPEYDALACGVAQDDQTVALLMTLPEDKRQPNLLFAAVRYLGGPIDSYPAFAEWVQAEWSRVSKTMLARRTQTNEAGRCATLLPWLVDFDGPLALVEVGASGGLCLLPDRYGYRYRTDQGVHEVAAEMDPVLECDFGLERPLPQHRPQVGWRAGLDLNPLDLRDTDTVRWLEALVWPGLDTRLARLRAAVRVALADPPPVRTGDLRSGLPALLDEIPAGLTPVVFDSAVLAYVDDATERAAFTERLLTLVDAGRVHWISNEAADVLPGLADGLREPDPDDQGTGGRFLLAVDGVPQAWAASHGQSLEPV